MTQPTEGTSFNPSTAKKRKRRDTGRTEREDRKEMLNQSACECVRQKDTGVAMNSTPGTPPPGFTLWVLYLVCVNARAMPLHQRTENSACKTKVRLVSVWLRQVQNHHLATSVNHRTTMHQPIMLYVTLAKSLAHFSLLLKEQIPKV